MVTFNWKSETKTQSTRFTVSTYVSRAVKERYSASDSVLYL